MHTHTSLKGSFFVVIGAAVGSSHVNVPLILRQCERRKTNKKEEKPPKNNISQNTRKLQRHCQNEWQLNTIFNIMLLWSSNLFSSFLLPFVLFMFIVVTLMLRAKKFAYCIHIQNIIPTHTKFVVFSIFKWDSSTPTTATTMAKSNDTFNLFFFLESAKHMTHSCCIRNSIDEYNIYKRWIDYFDWCECGAIGGIYISYFNTQLLCVFFLTFQIDTTKRTLLLCIADEANEKKCFLLTKKWKKMRKNM